MKRIISLVLVIVSILTLCVFCFTGCSSQKNNIAILWSGDGKVDNPNSLINSFERAMYIENVSYTHYGANGDAANQIAQAKEALNADCPVLVVELVKTEATNSEGISYAQQIVNAAKEKSVPVVFFNCEVEDEVINSYEKCVVVVSNADTIVDVQATMLADYVKSNFNASDLFNDKVKGTDKNKDNKISLLNYNSSIAEEVVETNPEETADEGETFVEE